MGKISIMKLVQSNDEIVHPTTTALLELIFSSFAPLNGITFNVIFRLM
jgi:hypothetical protein